MKRWLKFALRVLGMLFFFVVMTLGFLTASRGDRFLDLVERERMRENGATTQRLDEMEREYRMTSRIGYGVMAFGGILFLWSCLGLVRRSSETRKAGIAVVSLMGALVTYMTCMATYTHFRIKRVAAEHAGEITSKASLTAARFLFENDDWPRPYSNIVHYVERALAVPGCDDAWGHGILAECYMYGRGCEIDAEKSRLHAEAAARCGDARGKTVLKRLNLGEAGPLQKPNDGIRDLTGVDVTAVQPDPRRETVAEHPLGFFRKGVVRADAGGKVNHIGFLGNFGKGCAMTNGVDRLEKLFPELCRRLDCELYRSGTTEAGMRWWVFRLVQTPDWIVQITMYRPKSQPEAEAPLLATFDIAGLNEDGSYSRTNCRFERKLRNGKPASSIR